MDVGHDSSDAVVILNQAAPTGFFEHVQDLFPVAESIEESGQGSQVHTEGGPEQKMGSDTGQFVHIVRIYLARSGISSPIASSIHIHKA